MQLNATSLPLCLNRTTPFFKRGNSQDLSSLAGLKAVKFNNKSWPNFPFISRICNLETYIVAAIQQHEVAAQYSKLVVGKCDASLCKTIWDEMGGLVVLKQSQLKLNSSNLVGQWSWRSRAKYVDDYLKPICGLPLLIRALLLLHFHTIATTSCPFVCCSRILFVCGQKMQIHDMGLSFSCALQYSFLVSVLKQIILRNGVAVC